MNKTTLNDEMIRFSNYAQYFQADTPVYEFIHWLNEKIENKDPLFVKDYLPIVEETERNAPANPPFLTVITRTQGKRPEMLRETLLCLSAQSDMDFELLLIGHKLDEAQQDLIDTILNEQTDEFRNKIRYIKLDYGTRTTPLNLGFAYAYGEYVAVLDDDDLIFDHWVEQFHKGAQETPGRIIHSYVLSQDWSTVETDGFAALRAEAAHKNQYCKDFMLLTQLEYNFCPLMSLAFPTVYFKNLGMFFDETLTTTEDWDYFMRLSFISGVNDMCDPTAIYRLWSNAESSATVHNEDEWSLNYEIIQNKFKNMPILVPSGQDKIYKSVEVVTEYCAMPLRPQIKQRIRNKIPNIIWNIIKKLYRRFGGKKWLG